MAKKIQTLSTKELLEEALVSEDEQDYEVPENWIWIKLSAITEFERGITFPASAKNNNKGDNLIACIRTANVQEKLEIEDLLYVDKNYLKGNLNKLVRKDDIIMSSANSRELVGKTCYVEDINDEMTFGGFVLTIRARHIISRYLFYYLRLEFLSGRFMGESTQTTNIANINTTTLRSNAIPFPPLAEQQRIVDRIESLFEKLNQVKELVQSALDCFENRKAAILHKAFAGELTQKWREGHKTAHNDILQEILFYFNDIGSSKDLKYINEFQQTVNEIEKIENSKWYSCTIGAVAKVSNGSTPSRKELSFWNGTIPWVSSGEVRNNIITSTNECITSEGYNNSSVKILRKGTVLIAMIGEGKTRGQSSILDIEATINQNIAAIDIGHNKVSSKFMWYWLQYNYKRNREEGNGTGPKALNCQRVRELGFVLPPLPEQYEIVRILDNIFKNETQANDLVDVEEKIDLIKKAILARAFGGKLGTNNPAEPSSIELLKQVLD